MTIPEQAVQAMPERIFLGCADTDNEHQVWTDEGEGGTEYVRADLAAPHLASVRVNVDEIVQPLEDIHAPGGLCRWADVATAIGEVRRALSALQPSPRDELMKQIREGTAYGFLNDGSQPEGDPDLDCPYCCGSGHKGDIEPSAGRAAVLEEALRVAKSELEAWMKCANEARIGVTSTPHVIDHIDMVLASHPVADKPDEAGAQGEGWQPIESAPEGVAVETKIDDESGERNIQALVKRTRIPGDTRPMFWLTDGSMYVYYEPTHWRPLPASPGASPTRPTGGSNHGE